jgi:hypothetical protein
VRLSPFGDRIGGARAASLYLRGAATPRERAPTLLWVEGSAAVTGVVPEQNQAQIRLGEELLMRWNSRDVVHRSCAINTLAHELSHTISGRTDVFEYVFADRGRTWATLMGRALGSYTIGAVAQCTYLARNDRLNGAVFPCVQQRGTNTFSAFGCDGN